jgi:UPF0755 protein
VTERPPPSNGSDRPTAPPRDVPARPGDKAPTAGVAGGANDQAPAAAKPAKSVVAKLAVAKPALAKPDPAKPDPAKPAPPKPAVAKPAVVPRVAAPAVAAKSGQPAAASPAPRVAAGSGDNTAKPSLPRPVTGSGTPPPLPTTARPASASGATASAASTRPGAPSLVPRPPVAAATRLASTSTPRPANAKVTPPPAAGARTAAPALTARAAVKPPGKAPAGTGESYSASSEGLGNGAAAAKSNKHLAPRSPRTALEPDTVEMPPKRSKRARHPLVVIGNAIIMLFVLVAFVAAGALVFGKQRFDAPGPLADDRVVNIPRGSGIREISDVLMRDGVIDQPWVFLGGVLALKAREDLKAGEYQFKAHASLRDVVATIVDGRVVAHQLTVPEGLTSEQIVARLLDDDVLTGNIKEIPREGSLLPDTYNFNRGITREQIIQRMQQAQQHALKEVWDRHSPDLPIKTPEQLVALASLVEKETGKPEERTRVAAVFINRLKQKMRLQSDPTIIYGLVGGKGTLGRPIMKSEIEQPTPYNTYQIEGLPPGPIANPGRASLEAAANPARTRELYFVADGTGGHAFAETYEQHQKNVGRLRAMEAGDQKDQSAADPPTAATTPQAAAAPAAPAAAAPAQQRRTSTRHNQNSQNTQNAPTAR